MVRALFAVLLAFVGTAQAAGWKYGYADLQYGRFKFVISIQGTKGIDAMNEAVTVEGAGGTQRAIDPRSGAYVSQLLGGSRMLLEYLPYALAGGAPPAAWPTPSGYPTYSTPYIEWTYAVRQGAWEEIKTPAGSFKALRIEVEGNRGKDPDPFWWPKQAMRFVHTIWYAPEAGRYVKLHHRAWSMTGAQFADESVELLEFRPD